MMLAVMEVALALREHGGGELPKPGHFWLQEAESRLSFLREKGVYWKDKHA